MALPLAQAIDDSNVHKKHSTDRGNGLFATHDLHVKSQVVFVARPLLMVLDTAQLRSHCDYCFKSPEDNSAAPETVETGTLKRCTGYSAIVNANGTLGLSTTSSSHEAGLLPSGEWDDLHTLEDHYEKILQAGGKKWQDLVLMSKKIQKDSGGKRGLEIILRLVCLIVVNSFTLTSPTFDPIGLIFHPKSALFNHACNPNAFVRFDISPKADSGDFPPYGSISVHTLRPVSKDEELTISYIDTTSPRFTRQQELKDRYFFDCSCDLCSQGSTPILDGYGLGDNAAGQQDPGRQQHLLKIQASAEQYLEWVKGTPGMEHEHVAGIKDAMRELADTHTWGLHRYPWPQLRKLFFLGLLGLGDFEAAFLQCAILLTRVYPITVAEKHHPLRLVETWTLFTMCRALLATRTSNGKGKDVEPLATLSCAALHELQGLLDIGGRVDGQFERLVDEALRSVQSQPYVWGIYEQRVQSSISAWAWLKQTVDDYLMEEEGLQVRELNNTNPVK
ncbi:hypothetical protein LTR84_006085 [Exophiala bonariae]|uniref:SET domain-containing protein n=1 Tax=Exophiala bonariae TaxID=1690606 RepID=A0AAV9N1R8_9EURO|nr:hypothetical protein LTR84_006085 [Exophiala bonariae]